MPIRFNPSWGKAPKFTLCTLAIAIGLAGAPNVGGFAFAEGHEDGDTSHDGGSMGQGGQGGGGNHTTDGHEEPDDGDHSDHEGGRGGPSGGTHGEGEQGGGQQGQGEGQGGGGSGGQGAGQKPDRPVWAQEGIPEVELGRLNVARSPDRVLDRAYAEAVGSMTPDVLSFYARDLEGMISQLSQNWEGVSFIDSPLQNLALLREALSGQSILKTEGINPDNNTLMAVFLGTASDKAIPITTNTVLALTAIMGSPVSATEAAALAEDAERIRIAISTGHG